MRDRPRPDVLSALLRRVRITTSAFGRIELGAPWGFRIGPRDTVVLHHVLDGEMWLGLDGRESRIGPGDLVILAHGTPHTLRHRPGAPVADETPPAPDGLSVRRRYGGDGAVTVVLCAESVVTGAGRALLLRALPPVVHAPAAGEPVPGLGRLLALLREEVRAGRRGAPLIAARLAELLLLNGVRGELERPSPAGSWRAGLADDRVARALDALYDAPERPWSLVTLARAAGMSRSAFAHRFRELVGESPFAHLTRWRMELAKEMLREDPGLTLGEIASAVGYGGEFAFGAAFRRVVGTPPGVYRATASGHRREDTPGL
ncbi:AraC family transcriptional regulator [Rhizohabitans arisaemae]|uniref:AraC family transcriptional regulator n=1 Tax=Rhizohabitans arisaemae TaxID=2720610 RepID=UPI0024B1957A|nr:AraC family transcriptional regulator [Rhizohabitans arisaemae]